MTDKFEVKFSKDLEEKLSPLQIQFLRQLSFAFGNVADYNASLFRILNMAWGIYCPSDTNRDMDLTVRALSRMNSIRGKDNSPRRNRARRKPSNGTDPSP